jgi:hypothetical protein
MRRPKRVRLSRAKGFKLPEGAVVVARPSRWGNPFRIGAPDPETGEPMTREAAVSHYRALVHAPEQAELRAAVRRELKGKDLACWCSLDGPCHADALIAIANQDHGPD